MLRKLISALLVIVVTLVTVGSPKVFAQTLPLPATSVIEPTLPVPPAKAESELRKSVAAEVTKIKVGPLTEADFKRLEKERQAQQSGAPAKSGWTRKNTIFMTLFVVLMTGVVIVTIKHHCRAPNPCPEIDSSNYTDY